jgi:alkylation response protein AidB-like acyl-CoA dehydrogenase
MAATPRSTAVLGTDLGRAAHGQLTRDLGAERRRLAWSADGVDEPLWKELRAQGWFAALLPESAGGLGLGLGEVLEVFSALGRHLLPGPFLEHVLLLPALTGAGPAALDDLVAGERRVSWWDPAAHGLTRSPLTLDGDRVRGHLDGVRFALDTDDVLAVARTPAGGEAIVLAARPAGTAAVVPGPRDGVAKLGSIDLDGSARVLLTGAAARDFLDTARVLARLAATFELAGISGWLVDSAVDYAKLREQFGRPIGSFQAVAHLLADIAVREIALRNVCLAIVEDTRTGGVRTEGTVPAERAMAVKAYASTQARRVAETALQVHGGIGFTEEHPLHMYVKRALALYPWYGDPDRLAIAIGRRRVSRSSDWQLASK